MATVWGRGCATLAFGLRSIGGVGGVEAATTYPTNARCCDTSPAAAFCSRDTLRHSPATMSKDSPRVSNTGRAARAALRQPKKIGTSGDREPPEGLAVRSKARDRFAPHSLRVRQQQPVTVTTARSPRATKSRLCQVSLSCSSLKNDSRKGFDTRHLPLVFCLGGGVSSAKRSRPAASDLIRCFGGWTSRRTADPLV